MREWESLLCGYLAAGDAGELDELGRYLHDDVVVHDPDGLATTGLDHEKETWPRARNAMPGLHNDAQEIVSEGSTIAARVELSGILLG